MLGVAGMGFIDDVHLAQKTYQKPPSSDTVLTKIVKHELLDPIKQNIICEAHKTAPHKQISGYIRLPYSLNVASQIVVSSTNDEVLKASYGYFNIAGNESYYYFKTRDKLWDSGIKAEIKSRYIAVMITDTGYAVINKLKQLAAKENIVIKLVVPKFNGISHYDPIIGKIKTNHKFTFTLKGYNKFYELEDPYCSNESLLDLRNIEVKIKYIFNT